MNTFDQKNLEKLAKQASAGSKSTIDIFLKMLKLAQYSFNEFDTSTERKQNKPKIEFSSPSENISFVQNYITDSDEFKSRKQRAEQAVQLINTELNPIKLEIERLNNGFGEIEGLRKIRERQTNIIATLKKNIDAALKKDIIKDKKLAQDYKNELDNLREDYAQEYTNGNIGIEEIENIKNAIIQQIKDIPGNEKYIQDLNMLHDAFKKILTEKFGKNKYSFSELRDKAKKIIFDNKTKAAFIEFIQTQAVEGITREQKWSISDIATNRLMGMTLSNQARDEADEIAYEVSKDPLFYETLLRDFIRRKPVITKQQEKIFFNLSAYLKKQLAIQKMTQLGYKQRNPGELVNNKGEDIQVGQTYQIEPTAKGDEELSLEQWQEIAEDPSQILLSYYLNGNVLPALKNIQDKITELNSSDLNPQEKNEKLRQLQKEYNLTKDKKIEELQKAFNPKYKRNKFQLQMGDLQREINNMVQNLGIDDVIDTILSGKSSYKIIPKLFKKYMEANPENIFLVKNLLNGIIKSELIDQAKQTFDVSIPKVFEKNVQGGSSAVAKIDLAWLLAKQKILKAEEFLKQNPEAQQKLLEQAMEMLQFEKDESGTNWIRPATNLSKASIYQHVSPMVLGALLAKAKEKYSNFEDISGNEQSKILEEIYNKMYGYNVPNPTDPSSNLAINFPFISEKVNPETGKLGTGYTMTSRERLDDPEREIKEDLIQRIERARQKKQLYETFKNAEDNVSEHRYSTLELMIRKYAFKR